MPAIYWIVDHDLRIHSTGGAIKELLGYSPHRFVGVTLAEVHRTEPGTVDPVAQHVRALRGETVTYATQYRSRDLITTVCPHRVGDQIVGVIGTCIDVTASTMLERRMIDAQRAESLGVLAGGLAHDFNNLLVAVLGNADLALREIRPGAPGRPALDNIRQASLRAAELVEQLLAFAGRGGVAATRVSPGPLVDELLRIAGPTIPDNVAIRVEIPEGIAMRGDPGQIRQVVLNLIGNAREALGERGGTIQITATLLHHLTSPSDADDVITPPPGNYVMLEVADNGPGIDRDLRRRIFEPFFTTKSTGHGLGLAAVAGIVRAHGGGLRLRSSPNEGARFCVLWPSTVTPIEQPAVSPPAARTVLVIDDEDLVRDVVVRMIEDLGYAAIAAADGPAGLAIAARQPIDAVLVDLTMPQMSGVDVVSRLHEQHPDLPVIVCSGYDRGANSRLSADAYLKKPFRIEALEETLAKFLGPAVTAG
jgi:PAS domain S-box-containing protein